MRYYSSVAQATTLTAAATAGATTITVAATSGFPASYPYTLVLAPDTAEEEVVTVTGADGLTLSVVRGEDGSTAVAHSAGAGVRHMITARDLREAQEHINATSNVHGATGTLVTTSATQTLTNKTLDGSQNTFANIPASAVQGEVAGGSVPAGTVSAFAGASAPGGWLLCNGAAVSRTTYDALFAVVGTTYGAGDGSTTFNLPNLKGRVPVGLDASQVEFDALGEIGGEKMHTLTTAEMPVHGHGIDHTHSMTHTHPMSHSHTASASSISHSHSGTTGSSVVPASFSNTDGVSNTDYIRAGSDTTGRYSNNVSGSGHTHSFSTSSYNHTHSITVDSFNGNTGSSSASSTGGASSTTSGNTGSGTGHNNIQPYITLNYIIKA